MGGIGKEKGGRTFRFDGLRETEASQHLCLLASMPHGINSSPPNHNMCTLLFYFILFFSILFHFILFHSFLFPSFHLQPFEALEISPDQILSTHRSTDPQTDTRARLQSCFATKNLNNIKSVRHFLIIPLVPPVYIIRLWCLSSHSARDFF